MQLVNSDPETKASVNKVKEVKQEENFNLGKMKLSMLTSAKW